MVSQCQRETAMDGYVFHLFDHESGLVVTRKGSGERIEGKELNQLCERLNTPEAQDVASDCDQG